MTLPHKPNSQFAGEVCYLGLGANLGSRAEYLREAIRRLGALRRTHVWAVSAFHETEPYGITDQPRFLNAAAGILTELEPGELLQELLRIEEQMGRTRTVKWGPRLIDIDILLCGDRVVGEPRLEVPHPEMHVRDFVLGPLCEIAPRVVHPVLGKTIAELRAELAADGD